CLSNIEKLVPEGVSRRGVQQEGDPSRHFIRVATAGDHDSGMFELFFDEFRMQFLEMPPVVSDDGARMRCGEKQLFRVTLPQHAGVSCGERVEAAADKNLSKKDGNVFIQVDLYKMIHSPRTEGWTSSSRTRLISTN